MALTDNAKNYIKKAFGADSPLKETDPEFYEFFYNFAYDEVQNFFPCSPCYWGAADLMSLR